VSSAEEESCSCLHLHPRPPHKSVLCQTRRKERNRENCRHGEVHRRHLPTLRGVPPVPVAAQKHGRGNEAPMSEMRPELPGVDAPAVDRAYNGAVSCIPPLLLHRRAAPAPNLNLVFSPSFCLHDQNTADYNLLLGRLLLFRADDTVRFGELHVAVTRALLLEDGVAVEVRATARSWRKRWTKKEAEMLVEKYRKRGVWEPFLTKQLAE